MEEKNVASTLGGDPSKCPTCHGLRHINISLDDPAAGNREYRRKMKHQGYTHRQVVCPECFSAMS